MPKKFRVKILVNIKYITQRDYWENYAERTIIEDQFYYE